MTCRRKRTSKEAFEKDDVSYRKDNNKPINQDNDVIWIRCSSKKQNPYNQLELVTNVNNIVVPDTNIYVLDGISGWKKNGEYCRDFLESLPEIFQNQNTKNVYVSEISRITRSLAVAVEIEQWLQKNNKIDYRI